MYIWLKHKKTHPLSRECTQNVTSAPRLQQSGFYCLISSIKYCSCKQPVRSRSVAANQSPAWLAGVRDRAQGQWDRGSLGTEEDEGLDLKSSPGSLPLIPCSLFYSCAAS